MVRVSDEQVVLGGSSSGVSTVVDTPEHPARLRGLARRRLLLHQDGFALGISTAILAGEGILEPLLRGDPVTLDGGSAGWPGGCAASAAALAGAGWVEPTPVGLELSALGRANRGLIQSLAELTRHVAELPPDLDDPEWADLIGASRSIDLRAVPSTSDDLARCYLDGVVATPVLGRHASPATPPDTVALRASVAALGWGSDDQLTPLGVAARRYRPMYGLIGSYHDPLLACARGERLAPEEIQARTDRAANVAASGAAHTGYFHDATALVADVCASGSAVQAVVDVGCGDGTWIREIATRLAATAPSVLDRLTFIGIDYDARALDAARANLDELGAPLQLLPGDIGRPAALAAAIADQTGIDPAHTLHLRSFVDHNRRPREVDAAHGPSWSDGALAITHAERVLGAAELVDDWARHLAAWSAVSGTSGMIVLEAHTAPPAVVYAERGSGHRLAFQLYHSLSGQCPVPLGVYREAIHRAGLHTARQQLVPAHSGAISISHLVPAHVVRADT